MDHDEAEDPVVADIRKIRDEISAEFGHDATRYLDYLRERQKRHAHLLVSYAEEGNAAKEEDKPAA